MKKLILLALFFLPCLLKADGQWQNINFEYKDAAFLAGYVSASIYDISDSPKKSNSTHCVAWKMALGLSAGLAVAIGHANEKGVPLAFGDVVFGGLGGLTCVVVHF